MIAGAVVLMLVAVGFAFSSLSGGENPGDASRRRVAIDSVSGEVFENFKIEDGTRFPRRNPKTGTDTLYPAEACYWNADGSAKLEPTWVFVKSYAGESGDSTCSDCNRKVVPHNPMPPDDLMLAALERFKQSQSGGN